MYHLQYHNRIKHFIIFSIYVWLSTKYQYINAACLCVHKFKLMVSELNQFLVYQRFDMYSLPLILTFQAHHIMAW